MLKSTSYLAHVRVYLLNPFNNFVSQLLATCNQLIYLKSLVMNNPSTIEFEDLRHNSCINRFKQFKTELALSRDQKLNQKLLLYSV